MKIVALSDTHGDLLQDLPTADVYCICGDIMPLDIQRDFLKSVVWLTAEFFPWCQQLPCDKVFLVAGNHDFVFEKLMDDGHGNHRKARQVMQIFQQPNDKITYLENNEKLYMGVKFYGSPWCPDLANWAFFKDSDELKKEFRKIQGDVDVLLTHCPPRIEDYGTVLEGWGYGRNYGCQELADRLQAVHPKLHIFGHVHSGLHEPKEINGTTFCNVSVKNENYQTVFYPREFEI